MILLGFLVAVLGSACIFAGEDHPAAVFAGALLIALGLALQVLG